MNVVVRFTRPLEHRDGKGWTPSGIGSIIPDETVSGIVDTHTVALMPPTRMEFEDSVVVLIWERSEHTFAVSIHANLIADLTLRKEGSWTLPT